VFYKAPWNLVNKDLLTEYDIDEGDYKTNFDLDMVENGNPSNDYQTFKKLSDWKKYLQKLAENDPYTNRASPFVHS
jgi:hypothetical protein